MTDVQDLFYHGVRQQIRRVLSAMTDDEIDRGLDAFTNGASNWSECFFAQALEMNKHNWSAEAASIPRSGRANAPERWIADRLNLTSHIPVRIVYNLFDSMPFGRMTKEQLRDFISDVREERRPAEVLALLKEVGQEALEYEPA
jgi:hypothetical protein